MNPVCCGKSMGKAGFIWSGSHKVQRFKCNRCGRTTIVASTVFAKETTVNTIPINIIPKPTITPVIEAKPVNADILKVDNLKVEIKPIVPAIPYKKQKRRDDSVAPGAI